MTAGTGIRVGELVRAACGRDRGGYFLVLRKEGEYLWLCDGRRRKVANPKKKKAKHTVRTGVVFAEAAARPETVNNRWVRRCLAQLEQEVSEDV